MSLFFERKIDLNKKKKKTIFYCHYCQVIVGYENVNDN